MRRLIVLLCCLVLAVVSEDLEKTEEEIVAELANENNKFAASMFREVVKEEEGNFIFSPFSTQWLINLISQGTDGETLEELQPFTNYPLEAIRVFLRRIHNIENILLYNSATRIFLRSDIYLNKLFKKIANHYFKTTVESTDFRNATLAAAIMNRWINLQVFGRQFDPIEPAGINPHTNMQFVNTFFLNVTWKKPFKTRKSKFTNTTNVTKEVDMLEKTHTYNYYENEDINAKFLEIPYEDTCSVREFPGRNLSMVIILPNEKQGLDVLEQNLEKVFANQPLALTAVNVKIPQFNSKSTGKLKNVLTNLGISKIFDYKTADFSNLALNNYTRYFVTDIIQESQFSISSKGTEVLSIDNSEQPTRIHGHSLDDLYRSKKPKKFIADHPFIYYIQREGVVIFAGRVTDV